MKVYKDPNIPLTRTNADGSTSDALFWIVDGKVLVHPDRWDAFQTAINQPDVFAHPEVRALLLNIRPTAGKG